MRTKTLLLSAVALAAGLLSSQAQSNVYSANVVGYVTYVSAHNAPNFEVINNPLSGATNTVKGLFPTAPGGSQLLLWNGAGYDTAVFSALGGGHWRTNGVLADDKVISPGTGLFISVAGVNPYTNTFVGNVAANTATTVTNTIGSGLQLIGSFVPYSGNVTNTTALNLVGTAGGTQVLLWNAGTQAFDTYTWSALAGGHWKLGGVNTDLIINVNQGFFLNAAAPYNWVQTGPQ